MKDDEIKEARKMMPSLKSFFGVTLRKTGQKGEERCRESQPGQILNKVSAVVTKNNPCIVRDEEQRRGDSMTGPAGAAHGVRDDVKGRSMLYDEVCRESMTGRRRVCVDGRTTDNIDVLGEVCQGGLCVGGGGEDYPVLTSGDGGETIAGPKIESRFMMEEDWTHTESGTQPQLGGIAVHSVHSDRDSHVSGTSSNHSLKGKINFWETLGQGENVMKARNSGPTLNSYADRQEVAEKNHVAGKNIAQRRR